MKSTAKLSFSLWFRRSIFALLLWAAASGALLLHAQDLAKQPQVLEQPDYFVKSESDHIRNDKFRKLDRVRQLPETVREYLGSMADPGGEWQVGCIVENPPLPKTRLVFAGMSDDHLIVYYEQGGFSHNWLFDVFSFDGEKVLHRGRGYARENLRNVDELRIGVSSDNFN